MRATLVQALRDLKSLGKNTRSVGISVCFTSLTLSKICYACKVDKVRVLNGTKLFYIAPFRGEC
jgi:hypothetical protein